MQGRTIAIGDVVLYRGDGHNDFRVGEVNFHASLGGEIFVCLSHWPLKHETSQCKKAVVRNEFTIAHSTKLLQSLIFAPAKVGKLATVLMPAL